VYKVAVENGNLCSVVLRCLNEPSFYSEAVENYSDLSAIEYHCRQTTVYSQRLLFCRLTYTFLTIIVDLKC